MRSADSRLIRASSQERTVAAADRMSLFSRRFSFRLEYALGLRCFLQTTSDHFDSVVDLFTSVIGVNEESQSAFVAWHDWIHHWIGADTILEKVNRHPKC